MLMGQETDHNFLLAIFQSKNATARTAQRSIDGTEFTNLNIYRWIMNWLHEIKVTGLCVTKMQNHKFPANLIWKIYN